MDEEMEKILNGVFSVDDTRVVKKMLDVVNRDMSDSRRAKRIQELEYLVEGAIK